VKRLVHVSSIAVSNHFMHSHDQKESDPLPEMDEYESPYDISKRKGENIVLKANQDGVLATCSLRAGGVLSSPWDFSFRNFWPVIPGLIIVPRGSTIDFIDGRDVARGMLMAAQALETKPVGVAGEAFWLTKGWATSPGEISDIAAERLGYPVLRPPDAIVEPVRFFAWLYFLIRVFLGLRVAGVPPHRFYCMAYFKQTFDNSKIKEAIGFESKVSLRDCVTRIVDLYIHETGVSTGPKRCLTFLATSLLMPLALVALYMHATGASVAVL